MVWCGHVVGIVGVVMWYVVVMFGSVVVVWWCGIVRGCGGVVYGVG